MVKSFNSKWYSFHSILTVLGYTSLCVCVSCMQERVQAEALNKKLKAQLANFRVPDVMKYVEAKETNDRLRQTVKSLERKARVAEVSPEKRHKLSKIKI